MDRPVAVRPHLTWDRPVRIGCTGPVTSVLRCPVVVGRAGELAEVRRLVAAAASGRGGALAVVGEAGVGKTRLLDAAASAATDAGLLVLSGRAVQGGGSYRAIAEAVVGRLDAPAVRRSAAVRPYRAALDALFTGGARPAAGPSPTPRSCSGRACCASCAPSPRHNPRRAACCGWRTCTGPTRTPSRSSSTSRRPSRDRPVLVAVSTRDEPAEAAATARLRALPGITTVHLRRLRRTRCRRARGGLPRRAAAAAGGRPGPARAVGRPAVPRGGAARRARPGRSADPRGAGRAPASMSSTRPGARSCAPPPSSAPTRTGACSLRSAASRTPTSCARCAALSTSGWWSGRTQARCGGRTRSPATPCSRPCCPRSGRRSPRGPRRCWPSVRARTTSHVLRSCSPRRAARRTRRRAAAIWPAGPRAGVRCTPRTRCSPAPPRRPDQLSMRRSSPRSSESG